MRAYLVSIPNSDDQHYLFQDLSLVERSLAATYSAMPDKPTMVEVGRSDWNITLKDEVIGTVRLIEGQVRTEPTHF